MHMMNLHDEKTCCWVYHNPCDDSNQTASSAGTSVLRPYIGFITTIKYAVLLTLCLQDIVLCQDWGPRYRMNGRSCRENAQCNTSVGEVCWWFYDGCQQGECRCDPTSMFRDKNGKCRPLKLGDEVCSQGDKCPKEMSCQKGRCRCNIGVMTPDKSFCLKETEHLLGDRCNDIVDVCYQKSTHGYTNTEVVCSASGLCSCEEGYKHDGGSCRKWNVGEGGCFKDHNCQEGALCIDGECRCPEGYFSTGNSKCVKSGAKHGLTIGKICNVIEEKRYCAKGLVCHRCVGATNHTCVKFKQAKPEGLVKDSAPALSTSSFLCIMSAAIVLTLSTLR